MAQSGSIFHSIHSCEPIVLLIHYRWRVKSSAGKWFNTRHMATEESIRKQHSEATPVEGSRTEEIAMDQPAEMPAAMSNSQRLDLSVLIWPCPIPGRDGRIPLKGLPRQLRRHARG